MDMDSEREHILWEKSDIEPTLKDIFTLQPKKLRNKVIIFIMIIITLVVFLALSIISLTSSYNIFDEVEAIICIVAATAIMLIVVYIWRMLADITSAADGLKTEILKQISVEKLQEYQDRIEITDRVIRIKTLSLLLIDSEANREYLRTLDDCVMIDNDVTELQLNHLKLVRVIKRDHYVPNNVEKGTNDEKDKENAEYSLNFYLQTEKTDEFNDFVMKNPEFSKFQLNGQSYDYMFGQDGFSKADIEEIFRILTKTDQNIEISYGTLDLGLEKGLEKKEKN